MALKNFVVLVQISFSYMIQNVLCNNLVIFSTTEETKLSFNKNLFIDNYNQFNF